MGLLMAAAALVLASAACGEAQQPPGDPVAAEQRTMVRPPTLEEREKDAGFDGAVARAGDAEARSGGGAVARAHDAVASARDAVAGGDGAIEEGDDGDDNSSEVTLKVAGDPGTTFFGACSVGGREHDIEGRVPERYAYELDGGRLECEIRKEGGDTLEVAVIGEGVHSVQRSKAPGGTVRFTLSGDGLSYSTSSISLNQTVESSVRSFSDGSR